MIGNIHSIETFGTLDGPGVRFVVFLQGCPMRCLYCHNPDSWDMSQNKLVSSDELIKQYETIKEFARAGITISGGEPLVQIDFVIDLFKKAREKNIHTALDTSGILFNKENIEKFDELIKYTSLVLLDIKHIDDEQHKILTGLSNKNVLNFAKYLSKNNVPIWLRHVVVENYTYKKEYLEKLGEFLAQLNNIKALDILPYHTMGKMKYDALGLDYKLKNISPLSKKDALKAREIILNSLKNKRKNI